MDPIANISGLKSADEEAKKCIFCYSSKHSKDNKIKPPQNEKGYLSVQRSANLRKTKTDPKYEAAINRIQLINNQEDMLYHRKCFLDFTNSSNISRLKPKATVASDDHAQSSSNQIETNILCSTTNWNLCILCQEKGAYERKIKTKSMCDTIKELSEKNSDLKTRIGGGSINLISIQAKYHSTCILKFSRTNDNTKSSDLAMKVLCDELKSGAENGEVFLLADVWKRYTELATEFGQPVPASYESRRSTFKEKLKGSLDDAFQFYQPMNRDIHERQMMLIPTKYQHNLISQLTEVVYANISDQNKPNDVNKFTNIIKAAFEIRKDLQEMCAQSSLDVSEELAKSMIPQTLYVFLSIVMGLEDYSNDFTDDDSDSEEDDENDTLDDDDDDSEDDNFDGDVLENEEDSESDKQHDNESKFRKGLIKKVLSVAQDIIYITSNGRKITPKHMGLALALHQTKRSRRLVTLFNKAGHCMSYKQVLQTDNTLAELTLSTLDSESGTVVPPNIIPCEKPNSTNKILQVTADNIDLLTNTLDGKNSFHATQVVVFQRDGKRTDDILQSIRLNKSASALHIPAIVNALPAPIQDVESNPVFRNPVDIGWYTDTTGNFKTNEKDLSFLFLREKQPEGNRTGWTKFNKEISTNKDSVTASGLMPLILNPAHEYNTLTLVLNRCISLADNLNHKYVVLTVDQALYCRLINVRWASETFTERIILKMGGLHLANNYIKAIGQHMINTGLAEIWMESGILGEGAIAKVLDGRDYGKAMRVHKLTYQALWRILIPKFFEYLRTKDRIKADSLEELCSSASDDIFKFFEMKENRELIEQFLKTVADDNVNAAFWIQYIEYVSILLDFTRSMRDGVFDLYLSSLPKMLPLIARYDHLNYVKSLTVFIADMNNLPREIFELFKSGDFVVKRTKNKFNQVDADHAQEWLVGTAKESGGITGITNKEATLQRWALSFHWRTILTQKTFTMLGVSSTASQHNEEFPARKKRDNRDEDELFKLFVEMKVFSDDNRSKPLQNLVTKDVATDLIQNELLSAYDQGSMQVLDFVKNRLICQEDGNTKVDYKAPLPRINAMTMGTLEKQTKPITTEKIIMKNDAKFLQRIVVSYEAGRPINLPLILKHELHTFPLGLIELDGSLRRGDQYSLMNLCVKQIHCPVVLLQVPKESCHYIYNGDVVISKLGNPKSINSFGEYASKFISHIRQHSELCSRMDILFDRFLDLSPRNTNKQKSSKTISIRRAIEGENVPLPKSWINFLSSNENKADLAKFLSQQLSSHQFDDMNVVTAGGFENVTNVTSSINTFDVKSLISNHKEADVRAVLHAIESEASTIVINARDPEIFPLLIYFFDQMNCNELWLVTGSTKKYVPIHTIFTNIPDELRRTILAFHSVTGSTYTSQLIRITKAGAWKIFEKFSHLLEGLGDELLTDIVANNVEQFLLKCFMPDLGTQTFDDARVRLFKKLKSVAELPPTSDAMQLHIKRCHWATYIWRNACNKIVSFKDPIDYGWEAGEKNELTPKLTPSYLQQPETFKFISCGCTTNCVTMRCSCRKAELNCTTLCKCFAECSNVNNNIKNK